MIPWKNIVKSWPGLAVLIMGVGLATYTSYRASTLSLTHDEAIIHSLTQNHSGHDIYRYVIPQDHMLNTLLIKWSTRVFPNSDVAVRLPNLLGHLLYIIFSISLVWKLRDKHLRIAGFVLLNFNPYLLDFFSIARGYGLSISFMMVSIYFIYSYVLSKKIYHLALSLLFGIFSVLTIYTLLNYFIALTGVVLLVIAIDWLTGYYKLNRRSLLLSGFGIVLIVLAGWILYQKLADPISRVQSEEFIYKSAGRNFFCGTLRPIAYRSLYCVDPGHLVTIVSYSAVGCYVFAFLWMVWLAAKKKFSFTKRLLFCSFILVSLVALSVVLQSILFNIRFISNRTATFLVPLIVLLVIGVIQEIMQYRYFRIVGIVVSYLLAGLFIYNTVTKANFDYYLDWKYDANTKEMLMDLKADMGPDSPKPIKLGIVWLHEPVVNYYRINWKMDWLQKVDRNGYMGDFDYYYLLDSDSIKRKFDFSEKTIIKEYPVSKNILLKQ